MAEPASKKAFPLRISNRLFEQIRLWAEQDLRSINGQIEYLLADAVRRRNRAKNEPTDTGQTEDGDSEQA